MRQVGVQCLRCFFVQLSAFTFHTGYIVVLVSLTVCVCVCVYARAKQRWSYRLVPAQVCVCVRACLQTFAFVHACFAIGRVGAAFCLAVDNIGTRQLALPSAFKF